jgi:hypothetical protein
MPEHAPEHSFHTAENAMTDVEHFAGLVAEVKELMENKKVNVTDAISHAVGTQPELSQFEREELTHRLKEHFAGNTGDQITLDLRP